MEQITLFELLETSEPDFVGMTEAEIADYIGRAIGLDFMPKPIGGYMAKVKNLTFYIKMSTYMCTDRKGLPFIGVDYSNRLDHSGGGAPCDSLGGAIEWFNYRLKSEGLR